MSRLADALRRAQSSDAVELFHDADRGSEDVLWGMDRPEVAAIDSSPIVASARSAPRAEGPVEQHLAALVDRVFLPISGEPTRSVAFASTGTETGSGLLTGTAAEMLAERTTRNVCVIDANFRAPSLHAHFGVPNAAGLSQAFGSDGPLTDFARRLRRNLWVVPAGTQTAAPSFGSAARVRMAQFLAQFDFVLVEVEPVAAGSNVAGLLRLLGGVIVVVAADSTRRESARRATQTLIESGATVIGAVLTNRRFPIPDALYRLL